MSLESLLVVVVGGYTIAEAPFPGDIGGSAPSGIPGEAAEIGRTFLKEGVTSLLSFLAHVEEAGGVARQFHQPRLAVFVSIHGGLDEADRCGGIREDFPAPGHGFLFQAFEGYDRVDHAHVQGLLRVVLAAEEPDFAGLLLADHPGEVGGAVAGVEGTHFGPGLAENGIIGGNGQVADHGQDVAAADGIAGDHGDHGLRAGAYLAVQVQHVQPVLARPRIYVAGLPPHFLIAAAAEGPGAGPRQDDDADFPVETGVGQGIADFIIGERGEGVHPVGPVDGDPGDAFRLIVKDFLVFFGTLPSRHCLILLTLCVLCAFCGHP